MKYLKLLTVVFTFAGLITFAATGYEELTPEQVLLEIKSGKPTVLDVNLKEDYLKSHLPTAKLIQFGKREESMPANKNQRIIFYCMSELCSSSHEMARAALRDGYTNVAIMPTGLNGWIKAKLPTEN